MPSAAPKAKAGEQQEVLWLSGCQGWLWGYMALVYGRGVCKKVLLLCGIIYLRPTVKRIRDVISPKRLDGGILRRWMLLYISGWQRSPWWPWCVQEEGKPQLMELPNKMMLLVLYVLIFSPALQAIIYWYNAEELEKGVVIKNRGTRCWLLIWIKPISYYGRWAGRCPIKNTSSLLVASGGLGTFVRTYRKTLFLSPSLLKLKMAWTGWTLSVTTSLNHLS